MLPKDSRLRAREDFERLFRKGQFLSLGEILCRWTKKEEGETRIGVAFKQKVFRRAALRHLYKRKITEALRPRLALLPPGIDLVLLFQKRLKEESFDAFTGKATALITSFQSKK